MSPEPASAGGDGLLVAVVGPSGAGKDTLIRLALAELGDRLPICLARRVVTRPSDESSEDHDSLDEASFERAENAGEFCLSWRAHGLAYGLPRSVEARLAEGMLVIANLSRRSLADAVRRFGRLALVEITAPQEVLVARIAARGRESAAEIEKRLARQAPLEMPEGTESYLRIVNHGPPDEGAQRLARHLAALLQGADGLSSPVGVRTARF